MSEISSVLRPISVQPGNTKLGDRILSVSLPPELSCDGASEQCLKECFGKKARYHNPMVKLSLKSNYEATHRVDFVETTIEKINKMSSRIGRVHAVGDFYKNKNGDPTQYIRDWQVIVDEVSHKHFYAYTRSWVVPELRKELRNLGRRQNFTLWMSCDRTMPKPPAYWNEFKRAYMSVSDDDLPAFDVDLVFRAGSRKVARKKDKLGNQICPYEQGIKRKQSITCSTCGICFDQQPVYSLSPVEQLA